MTDNVRCKPEPSQELIDSVMMQIKDDIAKNDWTAIDVLLTYVPKEVLESYLPENEPLRKWDQAYLPWE